jgi:cytoskeletal protein CcmA (bactofilin family)
MINEGVEIEANIRVDSVMVSGEMRGQIDIKKQILIYSTGKVTGDLNTPVFSIEEGAFFEGICHMTHNEAEVHTLPLEQTTTGDKG